MQFKGLQEYFFIKKQKCTGSIGWKTASNGIISIKYKRVQEKRKFVKKSYVIGDEKNKLVHKLIVGICIAFYII